MPSLAPIRVAPGGRYFETFDGDPFLFIGANDAITWPGLAGLYCRQDIAGVEDYLHSLAASGVTILRIMLEYVQDDRHFFEQPFGHFNSTMVHLWDDLFARCEQFGLRILLTPWDTFWMDRRWQHHPYNRMHGGPASATTVFFSDAATVAAMERRLVFVVERWGGSGVLAAWDLYNEMHPYWGGTLAQQLEVVTRLSDRLREAEYRAWGFTRPQTISCFGPSPEREYEAMIFRHPRMDFATTHIYQGAIDYPRDTVEPAVIMGQWVRYGLSRTPPGRPFMDSEHGPIHLFNDHHQMLPEAFDDEYERHLMWAHLASGGAGSGLRWPDRDPHILTPGMRQALASLSAFTRLIDWRTFTSRPATADIIVNRQDVITFACRDDHRAIIWLLRGRQKDNRPGVLSEYEPLTNVVVTIRGLAPGNYIAQSWNTRQCGPAEQLPMERQQDGSFRIALPRLYNDLALAIVPRIKQKGAPTPE